MNPASEYREPRLLLLDTCGAQGTLALASAAAGHWTVTATVTLPGRSASERLLPVLRAMLETAAWTLSDLAAIAVVHGPGSFTGVRVGVSAAKGLAEGGGLPLLAISRLAVLADQAHVADPSLRVHAALDAGRGEVYLGSYNRGQCEREELLTLDLALEHIAQHPGDLLVCDPKLAARLSDALAPVIPRLVPEPIAADALRLAVHRLDGCQFADIAHLDALYLRRTEIEIRHRIEAHGQDLTRNVSR